MPKNVLIAQSGGPSSVINNTLRGIIDGCLQAMWDEGPGKRFSKHGHYINMSNPSYERVACGFAKSGTAW